MASSVEGSEEADLKDFLMYVFPKEDEEKILKMSGELKKLGIDVVSDFKYLYDDNLKKLQTFNDIGLKKFIDQLKKFHFEPLRNSVKEIFAGFPEERLNTIIIFLNAQQLYTRKDLLSADTNELRKYNQLSENEFEKIEHYLEQYNKSHYDKIKENKEKKESEDAGQEYEQIQNDKDAKEGDPERLQNVLSEIFIGVPRETLREIGEKLNKNYVFSRRDLLMIDTKTLRNSKFSLEEPMIEKIERYLEIRKKYTDDEEKLKEIVEMLNKFEIFTMSEFLEIAELSIKEGIFTAGEIKKIGAFLEKNNKMHYGEILKKRELEQFNPEILQHVLKKIFSGASDKRIREIEKILEVEEVYKVKDLLILNTNDLRKTDRLSESEIMKIEEYIKENRYQTIKKEEKNEKEKKTYELRLRRMEYDQQYSALTQEKILLLEDASRLEIDHKQSLDKLSEVQRNHGILFGYGVDDITRAQREVEKIEELLERKNHKISQIENKIGELRKVKI